MSPLFYHFVSIFICFLFVDEMSTRELQNNWETSQDTSQWKEILTTKHNISLDLKYGTKDNFMNQRFYPCQRCYLKKEVADAIIHANNDLFEMGYKLKLFDCYRPLSVQKAMWKHTPNASYVTPAWKGSMHNRGLAIDLTLTDLNDNEIYMGTEYDDFSPKAHIDNFSHPQAVLEARKTLKNVMKKHGLNGIRTEWWHYSLREKSVVKAYNWIWNCP